jgi:predicted metalloprotease with PDZ domain
MSFTRRLLIFEGGAVIGESIIRTGSRVYTGLPPAYHGRNGESCLIRGTRQFWFFMIYAAFVCCGSRPSFGQCTFPAHHSGQLITYSFEPVIAGGKMTLHITLEFQGSAAGESTLRLPQEHEGDIYKQEPFANVRALSTDTTLSDTESPRRKRVIYPPNSVVRVSYDLVKDWDGPLDERTRFHPTLEPGYFQIIGLYALASPDLALSSEVDVRFNWQAIPRAWSLVTSFGAGRRCQSFQGAWSKVAGALFTGGDYRLHPTRVNRKPFVVAIRGQWNFTDEQWVRQMRGIVSMERNFWHDDDFPYFFSTLTPFDSYWSGTSGTAYTNGFMMHHRSPQPLSSYPLLSITAHEIFHTWNARKLGTVGSSNLAVQWFSEGFTTYYADLLLFRAHRLSLQSYVERTNEKLWDYTFNPFKNLSNQELQARFRENPSINKLPYHRGFVLALWLDSQIRHESGDRSSLDTMMLHLAGQAAREKDIPFTTERLLDTAAKYLGADSARQFRQYVEQGDTIPFPESLAPCVHLRDTPNPGFDIGMDIEALLRKHVVANVKLDSEAFKAGARDGQEVSYVTGHTGDPFVPLLLWVHSPDRDRLISYDPRGGSLQGTVQQYRLDPDSPSSRVQGCEKGLPGRP